MIKFLRKLFGEKVKKFECVSVHSKNENYEYIYYDDNEGKTHLICRDLESSAWAHGNIMLLAYEKMLDVKSAL